MFGAIELSLVRAGCLVGVVVLLVLVGVCGVAGAVVPGPAWSVQSIAGPTNFIPGYEGGEGNGGQSYRVWVRNVGSRATDGSPVKIADTLPEAKGVTIEGETKFWDLKHEAYGTGEVGTDPEVDDRVVPPGDILELWIPVHVSASAPEGPVTNTVTVSGGGAPPVTVHVQNAISRTPAPFAINEFAFGVTGVDGTPDTQAGSHPYGLSTSIGFAKERAQGYPSGDESYAPSEDAKDIVTDLPLGFAGGALAAPRCPVADLEGRQVRSEEPNAWDCPADTQIGNITIQTIVTAGPSSSVAAGTFALSPVYNLVPERGHPVEFGFEIHGITRVHLFASVVHTALGYVLRVTSPDNSTGVEGGLTKGSDVAGATLSLFGDPEAEDGGRTEPNGDGQIVQSAGNLPVPSYTNPSDCSGVPLVTSLHVDTWEHPGRVNADGEPDFSDPNWLEAKSELPATTGCELLSFSPSLTASPDTTVADSPTGLTTHLSIPQAPNTDFSLAAPDLKTATVALPTGLALSPSGANGLQSCSDAQFAEESTQPATCPEASQVGTVVVHTPVLGEPLEGQVFLGTPNCGPCTSADAQDGSLVRLFMQLRAPASGIVIKVPGTTSVDPSTGALTASFPESPQQPTGDLTLTLKGGADAALATPQACGTYTTNSTLTPWSAPESGPPALSPSSFAIGSGCNPGFAPVFTAGGASAQAGAFSPLSVTFSRGDQEQDLSGVRVTTPPGLLATLRGVERCPEPEASQGTCGAGSLIGHATASAGAGPNPFTVQGGQVFLTGPYKGAPFGLSIVVPAVAGPFNLGNIVVRAAVSVDPHTAQITVVSDPIPSMVDGIPLQVKTVNVSIDRPGFMFNPTDCEPLSVGGMLSSTQGASAGVSTHFQVANCAVLPFNPKFSVSTQAATSKHNGASLLVKGAFPAGDANIHSVAVTLPVQLPARLTTIQQACTEAVFNANPASCPVGSNIGTATASTPILGSPIMGPVFLVSHGGAAFPDIVAILQAEGVTVDLTGSIDIKHGVTSSTFASVPDAPITSFQLTLPEGPHSGLAAVVPAKAKGSLCGQSLAMPFTITGQNGAVVKENNKIAVTGCPCAKKKAKPKPKKRKKG
jgi:hypothetical protein